MAVYAIFHSTTTDPEKMRAYMEQVGATLPSAGIRLLAVDDSTQTLEGTTPHHRTVILECDSETVLRSWHDSDGYASVRGLRQEGTDGFAIVVRGVPTE